MHLDDHVEQVRQQLAAAASLGDERTQQIAATLGAAVDPAVRLAVLTAVSEAADEISSLLLDFPLSPSVSVRLDAAELRVEVDATATAPTDAAPASPGDEDASARISLRLPESLKTQIDAAAARDGVSVNTWLVRAAGAALTDGTRRTTNYSMNAAHRISGFVNG